MKEYRGERSERGSAASERTERLTFGKLYELFENPWETNGERNLRGISAKPMVEPS